MRHSPQSKEKHLLIIHFIGDKRMSDFNPQHAHFHCCQFQFLRSEWHQQTSEWLKVDAQKCHSQFLLILTVWHWRSTGSVQVLWVPVDCAVLAVLVFTSECQSNPFDSHVCLGVLRVTLCSCNVLRLQHYQQKWIWAPSPLTSPSLARYLLPLGQPACPL